MCIPEHTALIKQKLGVSKENIPQVDNRAGSANEDHIWNQKYDRNVKRTIKMSDMALLLIGIIRQNCHSRHIHRLRVSVDSLLSTMNYASIASPIQRMNCVHDCHSSSLHKLVLI